MGKKSKRNRPSKQTQSSPGGLQREAPAIRANKEVEEETEENLRFEDPFAEEYIVEDEYGDGSGAGDGGEGGGGAPGMEIVQSWNPLTGEALQPGEKLEMDPSAYKMYHALTAEWPSLTFDFVRDDLGDARTRFPHSVTTAIGSQADRPENNQLTIMRLSDLSRIHVESEDDILGDELNKDDDDDEDSDSDDEIDLDPVAEHYSVKHYGGINRIRVMPQQPNVIATWSDVGRVNIFNVESILQRFSLGQGKSTQAMMNDMPSKPLFSYPKHETEGFAMDWSPIKQGLLATGDCAGNIHIWRPGSDGGYNNSSVTPTYEANPNFLHNNNDMSPSVEDLQWSPSEATVLASAECGGYVRIFDTRAPHKAMLCHQIHSASGADVNVLSWNKLVNNLLATGGDDGCLSVWDLRHFSGNSNDIQPLARFTPHKTPITSVEWHPTDESMLAASDDVAAYIYDLSVEEDDTAVAAAQQQDVPPQLLFVHSGSEQFKELHWHPQVSSCLMTTALSGFSVFIPSNL